MRVLDIDLDLFVDPRPARRSTSERLPVGEYQSWSQFRFANYLETQCGLSTEHPIRGIVVEKHHELFDYWKSHIEQDLLTTPFHLVHLDSHADMGMGDASCSYVLTDLLRQDVSQRILPRRGGHDGLLEGNFISFALACRWIASLTYVQHPELAADNMGLSDIPDCMYQNNAPTSNVIQLRLYPSEFKNGVLRSHELTPLAFEPPVPLIISSREAYSAGNSKFDLICIARSPRYTPESCDLLVATAEKYILR